MTQWLSAGDASAGLCPGPTPQFAEQIPAPALQYCAGGSCTKPAAPSVVAGTAYPQEVTITTTVPSDIPTAEIHIIAEAGNSSVATLWTYQLTHTPGAPFTANQTVSFGAPGLIEAGTNNYFRVSFCNAASGQCTCWSERSAVVSLPSFTSIGPAPPAATGGGSMALRVEDNFNRPDTYQHCRVLTDTTSPLGDGLGPIPQGAPASTGVWSDCPTPTAAEGVRIKSNAAYSTPSSIMTYTRQQAVGQHSYAEALFRVADPGTTIKYNLQSFTRQYYDASTSTVRFWAAKLMLDIRGCSVPTLGLYRFPDEYGQGGCGNQPAGANLTIPTADTNDKCDEVPPLSDVDSSPPPPLPRNVSKPVWLRVEVYDIVENGVPHPKIVGTVAWGNCPAGQDIVQCEHVCQHSRVDLDAPQSATNQFGAFGVGFHDKFYFVDLFRAGSELQ